MVPDCVSQSSRQSTVDSWFLSAVALPSIFLSAVPPFARQVLMPVYTTTKEALHFGTSGVPSS